MLVYDILSSISEHHHQIILRVDGMASMLTEEGTIGAYHLLTVKANNFNASFMDQALTG